MVIAMLMLTLMMKKDIEEYVKDQRLKLLSDEEYLKLVRKGKSDTFYMIEEI